MKRLICFVLLLGLLTSVTHAESALSPDSRTYMTNALSTLEFQNIIKDRIQAIHDKVDAEQSLTDAEFDLYFAYGKTEILLTSVYMLELGALSSGSSISDAAELMLDSSELMMAALDSIRSRYEKGELTQDEAFGQARKLIEALLT